MSEYIIYCGIFLIGVFISALAQIMLKKSPEKKEKYNIFTFLNKYMPVFADKLKKSKNPILCLAKRNKSLLAEYLNPFTVAAYAIFIAATLLTIFSYKVVPLSAAPILGATEYLFVAGLSKFFLKEKISLRKAIGLAVIIIGIIVYSI